MDRWIQDLTLYLILTCSIQSRFIIFLLLAAWFVHEHLPVPTFTSAKSLMRADKNRHTILLYTVDVYLGKSFNKTTQYSESIKSYPTTLDMTHTANMYSRHIHHTYTSIFYKMIFKNCLHTPFLPVCTLPIFLRAHYHNIKSLLLLSYIYPWDRFMR